MADFTIFDYLKYNNVDYYELGNQDDKERLERFVRKLEEAGLDKIILTFPPAYKFNPRYFEHNGRDFISGFPQDLTNKLILIWVNLD